MGRGGVFPRRKTTAAAKIRLKTKKRKDLTGIGSKWK
jgi:hypothetical protein